MWEELLWYGRMFFLVVILGLMLAMIGDRLDRIYWRQLCQESYYTMKGCY